MIIKLTVSLVLIFELINISISTNVHQSVQTKGNNHQVRGQLKRRLLPDVTYLLKVSNNGNQQKFLRLMNMIEVDDSTKVDDTPFTIIIPHFDDTTLKENKTALTEFIYEHVIPGVQVKTLETGDSYENLNNKTITIRHLFSGKWTVNDENVLRFNSMSAKLISFIEIDGNLTNHNSDIEQPRSQQYNQYNTPEKLVQPHVNKSDSSTREANANYLHKYLSNMESRTRIFQHFLSNSNLSKIFDDTAFSYIIFIPSDNAFQRWHPIDWGFYPFSVPEFTEKILSNHIVEQKQPVKVQEKDQKLRTLGGEYLTFKSEPNPCVNNISVISNATLPNGNQIFIISEVLFMSDSIVSKLHQQNKDKETPPLLAFPWFGSQFLSHSFLTLERDSRFTQITRLLSSTEIAPSIVASNYTFFVPFDDAFEKYGFDLLPDEVLSSEKGVKLVLNHFVKGRLYDRDLTDKKVLKTVGGDTLNITRDANGTVTVNDAKIIESEVFVYNLGTMFYIDDVLYPNLLKKELNELQHTTTSDKNSDNASVEDFFTTEISISESREKSSTTSKHEEFSTSSHREEMSPPQRRTMLSALLVTEPEAEYISRTISRSAEEFIEGADESQEMRHEMRRPMRLRAPCNTPK
ncbi:CLUMA_CG017656, isoform A [Clunio marinus]|uniref:CLUMA_CG017656, isoform A n=1 Tax=Clunio marinus TaxID=568069 RepID=A0A1J1IYF5_9DIPT|nr:CLUMA_CG017656, isoform A [Clunio marinus]